MGIVIFVLGAAGIYWAGRRAFYRRNAAGVEAFSSYGKAVVTQTFENLIRLVSIICVGYGIFLVVLHGFMD